LFVLAVTCSQAAGQSLPNPLISAIPAPGATGVPRNTAIALRFATNFAPDSDQITMRASGSNSPVFLSSQTFWVDRSTVDIVFWPIGTLSPDASYDVVIAIPGLSYHYSFRTGNDLDTTGPRLLSLSPDPNGPPADPWGPFIFRFDEPLLMRNYVVMVRDGGGNKVASGPDAEVRLSADRRSLEIRLLLQWSAPAIVEIRLGLPVLDFAQNPSSGSIAGRWMTTQARGLTGPRLVGQFPDSEETDVPTNAVPMLLFDRTLAESLLGEGGIDLEARGAVVPVQPRLVGRLVMLTGASLLPDTAYTVRVTTRLLDVNGMPVESPVSFGFTTGSGPAAGASQLVGMTPHYDEPGDEPGTPTNARMALRWGQRLPSFAPQLFDTTATAGQIQVSATLLADRRTLVISPRDPLGPLARIGYSTASVPLRDILGSEVSFSWVFQTSSTRDDEPPEMLATTPASGANGVPVNAAIRLLFNEPLSIVTPPDSVRLLKDGELWAGQVAIQGDSALEFRPARALDPDSDYILEMQGVRDLADNVMAPRAIRFHTALNSTTPTEWVWLTRSSLQDGDPFPTAAVELEFNLPMSGGHTLAKVTIPTPQPGTGYPKIYAHPVRVECSGTTIRIVPAVPWPSGRDLMLQLTSEDLWGRPVQHNAVFRAGSAGDDTRPEVLFIDPAPGTAILPGQTIRLSFSKAMLNASEANGGLVARRLRDNALSNTYWSDDRRSVTILPSLANSYVGMEGSPFAVVASSALVDLAGNPLKAVTVQFPVGPAGASAASVPTVLRAWPPSEPGFALGWQEPIVLALSAPVDEAVLNRSLWVMTGEGRAEGLWQFQPAGNLATFTHPGLWPAGSSVWLLPIEPVLLFPEAVYHSGVAYQIPTLPATSSLISRTTLPPVNKTFPANATLDIEFAAEFPAGPGPLLLEAGPSVNGPFQGVVCNESQPFPSVRRLTPATALAPGSYIRFVGRRRGPLEGYVGPRVEVGPPVSAASRSLLHRSPLPDAAAVPLSARMSTAFTDSLNPLSVNASTVQVLVRGTPIPASRIVSGEPGGFIAITPLQPLPPNETIQVKLAGVEDRLGRPLAEIGWSFDTGDAIDGRAPQIVYSNAPVGLAPLSLDPQTPLLLEYSEPLDPAALEIRQPAGSLMELSPDLHTLSIIPPGGWSPGAVTAIDGSVADWSGNRATLSLWVTAGLDQDRDPLILRATSIRNGQGGVPLNAVFALLFNKQLGTDVLRCVRLTRGADAVPVALQFGLGKGRVVVFPVLPLDPNTNYQLAVEGVCDSTSNVLASPEIIRFSTGEQYDVTAPTASVQPVSAGKPVAVRFSEPVDWTTTLAGANLVTWTDSSGGIPQTRVLPVVLDWSEDRTALTITPKEPFASGTAYTLRLGVIPDLAGNATAFPDQQFKPADTSGASAAAIRATGYVAMQDLTTHGNVVFLDRRVLAGAVGQ
jgi:hypothetical protein